MDKKKIIIVVLCFAFFVLVMMGINFLINQSERGNESADSGEDELETQAVEIKPQAPQKRKPAVQEQNDPQPQTGPLNI
ncbi:MAG TPA: hypothetical protein P5110_08795 [Candidatus Omnitrophota bacterium]|nr:hypothetical protein [Candidatus Omnitrophota bacterium]HRZ15588.1 hypothetical protein [Candidatus Omnitrophota bacterium]